MDTTMEDTIMEEEEALEIVNAPTGLTGIESVKSATLGRKMDITICQTNALVLISIKEPNINDSEINVLIEPQNLSVEICREDVENPVIAGTLFGNVVRAHCRVRIKKDSVLIKLRKAEKGHWKSILSKATTDLKRVTPETRVTPFPGREYLDYLTDRNEPIEPQDSNFGPSAPMVVVNHIQTNLSLATNSSVVTNNIINKTDTDLSTADADDPEIMRLKGVMDNIKQFHDNMFARKFNDPLPEEPEEETSSSGPFYDEVLGTQLPLIKKRGPPASYSEDDETNTGNEYEYSDGYKTDEVIMEDESMLGNTSDISGMHSVFNGLGDGIAEQ